MIFTDNNVIVGVTSVVFIMILIMMLFQKKHSFKGLPMVPSPHWYLGHIPVLQLDFQEAWKKMAYDYANADGISTFMLGRTPAVSVTRASDARSVFLASAHKTGSPLVVKHVRQFLGRQTILFLSGKEWKFHRSVLSRAFTLDSLKSMRAPMLSVSTALAISLIKKCDEAAKTGIPLVMEMEQLFKLATIDIFGRIAFCFDFKCCETLTPAPIAAGFEFLMVEMGRRLWSPLSPAARFYWLPTKANRRYKEVRNSVCSFIRKIIKERRSSTKVLTGKKADVLSSLLQAIEVETANGREVLDSSAIDEMVLDHVMGLLFAGYDTTSLNLTYAFYCLATNPIADARCLEEATRVLGKDPINIDPNDLAYCRATVLEAARLYPPGHTIERTLESDMVIGGHIIPQGTSIFMPVFHIHRDARHYPRPLEFLPERWAKRSIEGEERWEERFPNTEEGKDLSEHNLIPAANRNAFFAFAGGGRSCPGERLSKQEASIILAVLIRDLKFEAIPGYQMQPTRHGFFQRPKMGLPLTISKRL